MDLNLDTLKQEILGYLDSTGFVVFHGSPGGLEGLPMVLWDTERHPDYQMFLDVASKLGVKLVLFASREFETSELDDALAELEGCELPRDEHREYESRLHDLRGYEGLTCTLEVAFSYDSRLHVYEVQPDWYEEFLGIEEQLMAYTGDGDIEEDDTLGGFYSKN